MEFLKIIAKSIHSLFCPSFCQIKDHCNVIQKIIVFTIPLAICNANENSCSVEKLSSSQRTSSDSFRFSIESDIAELKA